jgi:hypothetical protein
MSAAGRVPSGFVILALACGATLIQCSYDVVFSRPGNEALAGASGRGNASQPSGGGAGSPTTASTSAGAAPMATFPPGISWQWQLIGALDTSVLTNTYVVDLTETTDDEFANLRSAGCKSICNFSAGTSETWRSDVAALPPEVLGNPLSGHSDEFWLDVRSASVRSIMTKRMDLALERGCDGVLPDSIDGYGADTGFPITKGESLDYLSYLSQEAHSRSLAIGLSNASELVATAVSEFDFEVEVNCLEYDECEKFLPFLAAQKSVLHAELVSDAANGAERLGVICSDPRRAGFSTILKTSQLDAWRMVCE